MLEGTVSITTSLTNESLVGVQDGIFTISIIGKDDVNRGYISPVYSRNREGVFEEETRTGETLAVSYPSTSASCRATPSWLAWF